MNQQSQFQVSEDGLYFEVGNVELWYEIIQLHYLLLVYSDDSDSPIDNLWKYRGELAIKYL